jgi:hypothetical protein
MNIPFIIVTPFEERFKGKGYATCEAIARYFLAAHLRISNETPLIDLPQYETKEAAILGKRRKHGKRMAYIQASPTWQKRRAT